MRVRAGTRRWMLDEDAVIDVSTYTLKVDDCVSDRPRHKPGTGVRTIMEMKCDNDRPRISQGQES